MSPLRAHPIPHYALPAYPLRLALAASPELLKRHLPPAWRKHAELAGATGLFLAANLAGCTSGHDKNVSPEPSSQASVVAPPTNHGDGRDATGCVVVAPLFMHGEGRGATGCVVVSPPAFLSEEEALQVIREELGSYGITLTDDELTLTDVEIPQVPVAWVTNDAGRQVRQERPERANLALDAVDVNRHIAVEFASAYDQGDLAGPWEQAGFSSVTRFNLPEVAVFIAEHAEKSTEHIYCGFFYDPLECVDMSRRDTTDKAVASRRSREQWRKDWQERERLATDESKRLLRLQVRDFVDWLKAQGAI